MILAGLRIRRWYLLYFSIRTYHLFLGTHKPTIVDNFFIIISVADPDDF
jgi:hypothetical protein